MNYTKEEFNSVWKYTSKENILNQFYYEHIELQQLQRKIDKAIEYIEKNKLNSNKISEMLCGSEIVELLEILKGSEQ